MFFLKKKKFLVYEKDIEEELESLNIRVKYLERLEKEVFKLKWPMGKFEHYCINSIPDVYYVAYWYNGIRYKLYDYDKISESQKPQYFLLKEDFLIIKTEIGEIKFFQFDFDKETFVEVKKNNLYNEYNELDPLYYENLQLNKIDYLKE